MRWMSGTPKHIPMSLVPWRYGGDSCHQDCTGKGDWDDIPLSVGQSSCTGVLHSVSCCEFHSHVRHMSIDMWAKKKETQYITGIYSQLIGVNSALFGSASMLHFSVRLLTKKTTRAYTCKSGTKKAVSRYLVPCLKTAPSQKQKH
jgi:hypothetical protein